MIFLVFSVGILGIAGACLLFLRLRDVYERDSAWASLMSETPWHDVPFDAGQVESLPPAARRFFEFAIRPGTPIRTVAILAGTEARGVRPSRRCHDLVAAPSGAIHRFRSEGWLPAAGFAMLMRGRFLARSWILGVVPWRSSGHDGAERTLERLCAYAVLFAPATMLPGNAVCWQSMDDMTARATVSMPDQRRTIEIDIAASGQPMAVRVLRADAGADGLAAPALTAMPRDFGDFDGYRLPREVSLVGNGLSSSQLTMKVHHLRFAGPWSGSSHT